MRLSFWLPIPVFWLLVLLLLAPAGLRAEPLFPHYDEIRPNVAFWQDIYSRYYSTQGMLHDRNDLAVVYTVLEVENTWDQAARQRNRAIIDAARQEYREILLHLATGKPPRNDREARVQELFGPRAEPEYMRRAAENIRFQRGLRDRFQEGVIRSGAYLQQIKEILRHYGVPEELAYLPHVESSFNYEAYSRLGAAGIWQFMRSTGRQYLNIDYELDERRDPIRATHAAARLLRDNYQRLGTWPLAITAYNHGATGMLRARNQHGDYPAIFLEYSGSRFGFASRNFYSEFLAAKEVAQNTERYFGALELALPRRSHEVVLSGYVPLAELAAHLGIDVATLHGYNQGLREPVLRGEKYVPKGYRLRVPADRATAQLASALPTEMLRDNQRRSAFYMVRRGDTAWEIARRNGVSLRDLRAANQLDSRATIYAGQNLRIPGVDEPATMLAAAAATGEPKTATAAVEAAESVESAAASAAGQGPGATTVAAAERTAATAGALPTSSPAANIWLASARGNGLNQARSEMAALSPDQVPDQAAAAQGPINQGSIVQGGAARDSADQDPVAVTPTALLGTRTALALSGSPSRLPAGDTPAAGAGKPDPMAVNPAVVWGNLTVEELRHDAAGRLIGYIRVEVEETLGHYADWLGIATQELRRLNGLPFGRPIRLDQRLKIPLHGVDGADGVDRTIFEERRYEYHKSLEEDFYAAYRVEGVEPYRIKPGDNIWALGRNEFELPLWLIRKYNPELNLDSLQLGEEIRVPLVVDARSG